MPSKARPRPRTPLVLDSAQAGEAQRASVDLAGPARRLQSEVTTFLASLTGSATPIRPCPDPEVKSRCWSTNPTRFHAVVVDGFRINSNTFTSQLVNLTYARGTVRKPILITLWWFWNQPLHASDLVSSTPAQMTGRANKSTKLIINP